MLKLDLKYNIHHHLVSQQFLFYRLFFLTLQKDKVVISILTHLKAAELWAFYSNAWQMICVVTKLSLKLYLYMCGM